MKLVSLLAILGGSLGSSQDWSRYISDSGPLGIDTSIVTNERKADRCLALACAGGGAKGGFQDGALWQMVRNLPADDVKYEVLSGVSAGSINLAGFSLYEMGDELNAT